jgi:ribosomal protein S18 acetylase RimI-like enzyme
MQLTSPTDENITQLMTWFSNEAELLLWSGPNFRFPFNVVSFKQDLKLETLASFALMSNGSDLIAFGQYYLRLGRCHLGRLVVNPNFRGKGIAAQLIHQLSEQGKVELNTESCSLFVLDNNINALKAYEKIGYKITHYPDEMPLKNCLYMIKL